MLKTVKTVEYSSAGLLKCKIVPCAYLINIYSIKFSKKFSFSLEKLIIN